jgi:hypothetical protein
MAEGSLAERNAARIEQFAGDIPSWLSVVFAATALYEAEGTSIAVAARTPMVVPVKKSLACLA